MAHEIEADFVPKIIIMKKNNVGIAQVFLVVFVMNHRPRCLQRLIAISFNPKINLNLYD
jgi:hypothetical protein